MIVFIAAWGVGREYIRDQQWTVLIENTYHVFSHSYDTATEYCSFEHRRNIAYFEMVISTASHFRIEMHLQE